MADHVAPSAIQQDIYGSSDIRCCPECMRVCMQ